MSKPANNARARGSKPGTLKRLVKMLFSFYPVLLPLVMLGVVMIFVMGTMSEESANRIGEVLTAEPTSTNPAEAAHEVAVGSIDCDPESGKASEHAERQARDARDQRRRPANRRRTCPRIRNPDAGRR